MQRRWSAILYTIVPPHQNSRSFLIRLTPLALLQVNQYDAAPQAPLPQLAQQQHVLCGRCRDLEVPAYLLDEKFLDLAMPRNRRDFPQFNVHVNRMAASFSQKATAMFLKVTNQVNAFHIYAGSLRRSRITLAPASSCSAKSLFVSSTNPTASRRFSLASSNVSP